MQSIAELFDAMTSGDRQALAKAITLVESKLAEDHTSRLRLLDLCHATPKESTRIAVTGAPGAGKSSLIEKLGLEMIGTSEAVAVLTIDPTSERTGGSILGDKTRMTDLSRQENAFIRPSPTSGVLGGVAEMTRETILLCESAGYTRIIVETVGVGQSETAVSHLVDVVLFVTIAGAGDSLQGIKRGILETADLVAVNKCDGSGEAASKLFASELSQALLLLRGQNACPAVVKTSALSGLGVSELLTHMDTLVHDRRANGQFNSNRAEQRVKWFDDATAFLLEQHISSDNTLVQLRKELADRIQGDQANPYAAANELVSRILRD